MEIKEITRYKLDSKEFKTLNEVKNHVENIIGSKIVDEIVKNCPPAKAKDINKILEVITHPESRKILLRYLDITFEKYDNPESMPYDKNILDL